jgi:hypothetical protein
MSQDPTTLGAHDSLYVSTRDDDALAACAARMEAERRRGLSVLVLSVFEGSGFAGSGSALFAELGVATASLGLDPEGKRGPGGKAVPFRMDVRPEDDAVLQEASRRLDDLRPRIRPRHVYIPLAVGGSFDQRIAYEAARAGLAREHGRNVFLYEDRPEALVPGAVRVRLGLLGARLPAGALRAAGPASLLPYLARVSQPASFRGEKRPLLERLRVLRRAAGLRRLARAWNAQRAFGPRLQPVLHVADDGGASAAERALGALIPKAGVRTQAMVQSAAYARVLGQTRHAERYWLLLPERESAQLAEAELSGAEP